MKALRMQVLQECWFGLVMILSFVALAGPARAVQTVLAVERFEGIGTLDASDPGALGTWVTGAWAKRAIGPRFENTDTRGWSGDAQGSGVQSYWDLASVGSGAARRAGMVGCWVRFTDFSGAGYYSAPTVANPAMILRLSGGGDNSPVQGVGVTTAGQLITRRVSDGTWQANSIYFSPHRWYWVQIEWETTASPARFATRVSCQPLGGPPQVLPVSDVSITGYFATRAHVGDFSYQIQPGQNYRWRGRLGSAVLASLDALEEGTIPPEILPPIEERHTWHVNPATGDDHNDGLSPGSAWRTVAKVNLEGAHSGFLSSASYTTGDTLVIDTSLARFDVGTTVLTLQTTGLTVQPAPGQPFIRFQAERDISAGAAVWTAYDPVNFPNIWQTTDSGASDLQSVVLWEDDKWLYHPTGATIADVRTALNTRPGSYYSDGTTLYLHPFGSTSPATDGKTYTRSRYRDDRSSPAPGPGQSAIFFNVDQTASMCLIGAHITKTALSRSTDNNPILAYGVQIGHSRNGGEVVLRDCYAAYNSKHAYGTTVDGNDLFVLMENCRAEQCQPSGTVFVDFNGTQGRTGNRTIYRNCSSFTPLPVIGSTAGTTGGTAYISHNSGGSGQFSSVTFEGGIYNGNFSVGGSVTKITLTGTRFGGNPGSSGQGCRDITATQCTITGLPLASGAAGSLTVVRNCLLPFELGQFVNNASALTQGTVIYEGNTFDLRPYRVSDVADFALFRRISSLNLTFRNNIFIVPSEKQFTLLDSATSTDTLNLDRNLYQLGSLSFVVKNFHDGFTASNRTFAQWQALGHDLQSQTGDPSLAANYAPLPGSPAIQAGFLLGPLSDFTGRTFQKRDTLGAVEPPVTYPHWRFRHFDPSARLLDSISGPDADPDDDGLTNLLEYAFQRDPHMPDGATETETWLADQGGETFLTLRYTRPRYVADLNYTAQSSSDLADWTEGPGATVLLGVQDNEDDTEDVLIRDALPASAHPSRFLRMRVEPVTAP